MKKLYSSITLLTFGLASVAQTFQASVRPGSAGNSVIVSVKPSANVTNSKLSTINLCLAVPSTAAPKPTAAIKTNYITTIAYTPQEAPTAEAVAGKSGTYYLYNFIGDGSQAAGTEKNYTAGVDNDVIEVEFTGGPIGSLFEVLLLNQPDGGGTLQSSFYIANQGTDVTNTTAMYYGAGAVNDAAGYSGTSFVAVSNVTLPVKFLSFYALKNGDDAKLNWTVDNDDVNKYFEIERSFDGRSFKLLSRVNAKGNGSTVNTYETSDFRLSSLRAKNIYYRVKQVDLNDGITYSSIRTLNADLTGAGASLYPNPVKNITKLVVDASNQGRASVLVRDVNGKLVKQVSTEFIKGINQVDLQVNELAAGQYNVVVVGEGFSYQLKMTKIN